MLEESWALDRDGRSGSLGSALKVGGIGIDLKLTAIRELGQAARPTEQYAQQAAETPRPEPAQALVPSLVPSHALAPFSLICSRRSHWPPGAISNRGGEGKLRIPAPERLA